MSYIDRDVYRKNEDLSKSHETASNGSMTVSSEDEIDPEEHGRSDIASMNPPGDILPRDRQQKTPTYDYTYEKSMSQAEAKLFYHHHQLASRGGDPEDLQTPASPSHHSGNIEAKGQKMPTMDNKDQISAGAIRDFLEPQSVRPLQALAPTGQHTSALKSEGNLNAAEQLSKIHASHSGVNPEQKPSHSSAGGTQTPNPWLGPSQDTMNLRSNSDAVATELNAIYGKIRGLLDRRSHYVRLSVQGDGDNPKDHTGWRVYPPPPEPAWDGEKDTGNPGDPCYGSQKRRKMGQDIGEDFDMAELMPLPGESDEVFRFDQNSVYQVYETTEAADLREPIVQIPSLRDFYMDLEAVIDVSSDGPAKSFAFKRLSYLEGKFQLYALLNEYQEMADSKKVPHRDFYNVRKVDTHVHHSACMNQKHLLRFIKSKMKKSPDEVVLFRDGKHLTLREVFESIKLTAYDLSIDTLDMHAHTDSFHRFDKFNLKYNPVGESRLREIFLKTDNYIKGRYLAEITKEVISDLESSKYQMVEWRISIYGRSVQEWDKLAAWVIDNKLFSPNVRWLIQIPRLYDVYKASGMMENFEQVITNVFQPLFEVTKDPRSHPKLHVFLQRVVGFDSVDDESKAERRFYRKYPVPRDWDTKQNPPYSYWIYFMFANIASLNIWRKRRGFNTFVLRPHCGEAGDPDHLAVGFLCCHSISHGILLRKVPLLQYLFYLDQIGIAMSPLSNNALFLTYDKNPCASFFRRGLNISLSTDDPLQFAFTKEPLIEEYSVAAQIYKFSAVDMCELAKHSVEQSGFELSLKERWLGDDCCLPGVAGNNVAKSNVPDIREAYRHDTLLAELMLIARYSASTVASSITGSANRNLPINLSQTTYSSPLIPNMPNFHASSQVTAAEGLACSSDPGTGSILDNPQYLSQTGVQSPVTTTNLLSQDAQTSQSSGHFLSESPMLAGGTGSAGPASTGTDNLPEQKIFPGVVHERAQRSSRFNRPVAEDGKCQ
ncbi:AMP deaminase [Aspergillus ruber CBS 135680]|uniref:AMP deaminase n=1 Tax=Aspergillus ruber (strain CBS 135680) TaxID=1388766 RepID=A0A017SC70_ASPRC|nr:AMP deaminase [Aspergillus ruber CBS 135680]EYE93820.1 AMP deaminase [Aspergillus ruber CBS 135680]